MAPLFGSVLKALGPVTYQALAPTPPTQPEALSQTLKPDSKHRAKSYQERKTIPCEYCSKLFACKFNLEQHKRVHTYDKPFQCSLCEASYTRQWLLNRHFRTKHTSNIQSACGDVDSEAMDESNPNSDLVPDGSDHGCEEGAGDVSPIGNATNTDGPDLETCTGDGMHDAEQGHLAPVTVLAGLSLSMPSNSNDLFGCYECGLENHFMSAMELQQHRHRGHGVPFKPTCNCSDCINYGRLLAMALVDGNECTNTIIPDTE